MKVNADITRKFNNDCWCSSISKATGISYDSVYKAFKPFLQKNKGADLRTIKAYLNNKGYHSIKVDLDLETALQIYNTNKEAKAIFSLEFADDDSLGHMIYVKDKIIFDELNKVDYDSYIEQWKVDMVFIKEIKK